MVQRGLKNINLLALIKLLKMQANMMKIDMLKNIWKNMELIKLEEVHMYVLN